MRRILIDDKNTNRNKYAYGLPWRYDATCFNFNSPDETITTSEICNIDAPEEIESLVISCDLEDYNFISKMKNLRQLYIYEGANISDLSFVKNLTKLRQLCIGNTKVNSLEPVKELLENQKKLWETETDPRKRIGIIISAICISSSFELNGSILLEPDVYVSEIIINKKEYNR